MHIPFFINVDKWRVLVIGGGHIALRKAKELYLGGAEITLLAPARIDGWQDISVNWLQDKYMEQNLSTYDLIIAATDDDKLNRKISRDAAKYGIFCNCASKAKKGNVILPGVVRENGITIAISTEGETPFLTKRLKNEAKKLTEDYSEDTISLLGEIRREIIEKYPTRKKELLNKLNNTSIEILKEKGNCHEITDWLQRE